MNDMLTKVKANLIIADAQDDDLLTRFISAATSYAEAYQHLDAGYYGTHEASAVTEQAIIMLTSHFYESRDGATGGFFVDTAAAAAQSMKTVNDLLRLDRDWQV